MASPAPPPPLAYTTFIFILLLSEYLAAPFGAENSAVSPPGNEHHPVRGWYFYLRTFFIGKFLLENGTLLRVESTWAPVSFAGPLGAFIGLARSLKIYP